MKFTDIKEQSADAIALLQRWFDRATEDEKTLPLFKETLKLLQDIKLNRKGGKR